MKEVVLWENRDWVIFPDRLESKGNDHQSNGYFLDKERLEEPDWIEHVTGKGWCDPQAFVEAYYKAFEMLLGKTPVRDVLVRLPNNRSFSMAKTWLIARVASEHAYGLKRSTIGHPAD